MFIAVDGRRNKSEYVHGSGVQSPLYHPWLQRSPCNGSEYCIAICAPGQCCGGAIDSRCVALFDCHNGYSARIAVFRCAVRMFLGGHHSRIVAWHYYGIMFCLKNGSGHSHVPRPGRHHIGAVWFRRKPSRSVGTPSHRRHHHQLITEQQAWLNS